MGIFEADAENYGRAGDSASHPGHLELCGPGLCVRSGAGTFQRSHRPVGAGCSGNIFPTKRYYPVGNCVPHQPVRTAAAGILAAGQGAGFEVCHTGFDLRIKTASSPRRRGRCSLKCHVNYNSYLRFYYSAESGSQASSIYSIKSPGWHFMMLQIFPSVSVVTGLSCRILCKVCASIPSLAKR